MDQGRRKVAQLPVHSIRLFSVSRMHWCQHFCWFLRRQIRNDGENAMIQGAVNALNVDVVCGLSAGNTRFDGETEFQRRAELGES